MRSLYNFFYYLLKKIKSKVNNNLVKFLVKYKLFNLLSILFIFSLKKIRGTRAKKK